MPPPSIYCFTATVFAAISHGSSSPFAGHVYEMGLRMEAEAEANVKAEAETEADVEAKIGMAMKPERPSMREAKA